MMWKKIKDYEQYKINERGDVRRDNKLLRPGINSYGYVRVSLSKDKKCKQFKLHRLLGIAFIPNPENKPEINHIDGNKCNNELSNLEWCTRSENILHAVNILKTIIPPDFHKILRKSGKDHWKSKPFEILYLSGHRIKYGSAMEFERMTGYSHGNISHIRIRHPELKEYTFKKGKMKDLVVYL